MTALTLHLGGGLLSWSVALDLPEIPSLLVDLVLRCCCLALGVVLFLLAAGALP